MITLMVLQLVGGALNGENSTRQRFRTRQNISKIKIIGL